MVSLKCYTSQLLSDPVDNIQGVSYPPEEPGSLTDSPRAPSPVFSPSLTPLPPTKTREEGDEDKPGKTAGHKIHKVLTNMDEDVVRVEESSVDGICIDTTKREESFIK